MPVVFLKRITSDGYRGFTRPYCSAQIVEEMKRFIARSKTPRKLRNMTITDATAGIGGDTLQFSFKFRNVNAVEPSPSSFAALVENCADTRNVTTINGDYMDHMRSLVQDIVYLDPEICTGYMPDPGAPLELSLNGVNICEVVAGISSETAADFVFIKAPRGSNLSGLRDLSAASGRLNFRVSLVYTDLTRVRFYYLICIRLSRDKSVITTGATRNVQEIL